MHGGWVYVLQNTPRTHTHPHTPSHTHTLTHTLRGAHGAGVTSIHPLASHPYLVLSGSYDCTLRVWDVRGGGRRPVVEHALELGGGVWRMQPNPQDASVWLMACMQEGVKGIGWEGVVFMLLGR